MSAEKQSRKELIKKIKARLSREGFPRLQISLILAATAFTGFLTSFVLLNIGIDSMAFRYPVAIFIAYCFFLVLLRIWLWFQNRDRSDLELDVVDGVEIPISIPDLGSSASEVADYTPDFGGGGDFAGAGAGGDWGAADVAAEPASTGFADLSSAAEEVGDSITGGFDIDDGIWILLIIVALSAALIAVGYIVYIAPVLFAEVMVDGALVTGLYRRVKKADQRHWLSTAVKKTLLPAFIVALSACIAGFAMQELAPDARSIGEFWSYFFLGVD